MVIENEKGLILNENSENNSSDIEVNSNSSETSIISEKLETKGLKLKKSTKEKLNSLQNNFGDAETMISTLINQYESIKIQNDSKFADRKAEIEKFNYLLHSIRGSYLNSLDMASYLEDKYNEKFQNEIKKREKLILSLQEENSNLKKELEEKDEAVTNVKNELKEVKDSYSRINMLLSTLEKDANEKSQIIQNLQNHIDSLNKIVNDDNLLKEKNNELSAQLSYLRQQLADYELIKKEIISLNAEIEGYKEEIVNYKEEIKNERKYSEDLNSRIQNILISNSNEIIKLKDYYSNELKLIETEKTQMNQSTTAIINDLKESIYKLKLELEITKNK